VVLLCNVDQHWMSAVLTDVGMGVVALLAGEQPTRLPFVGMIPWVLRGLLLVPALQIAGVVATLGLLRRWRQEPERLPGHGRVWGPHTLLPLIPDLLLALNLIPTVGKRRGYLLLFKPDSSWTVLLCGAFALRGLPRLPSRSRGRSPDRGRMAM
jgi:hypothetical protein